MYSTSVVWLLEVLKNCQFRLFKYFRFWFFGKRFRSQESPPWFCQKPLRTCEIIGNFWASFGVCFLDFWEPWLYTQDCLFDFFWEPWLWNLRTTMITIFHYMISLVIPYNIHAFYSIPIKPYQICMYALENMLDPM
jgi:hypothetical protein